MDIKLKSADGKLEDSELQHISDEIMDSAYSGDISKSDVLKDLYLARAAEKRYLDMERLHEAVMMYLGLPEVQRQHPSLADACDGRADIMAKYIIQFMIMLSLDGIDRGIEFCTNEVERAFSRFVYGEARLREP